MDCLLQPVDYFAVLASARKDSSVLMRWLLAERLWACRKMALADLKPLRAEYLGLLCLSLLPLERMLLLC
jgi:hypothetical protein